MIEHIYICHYSKLIDRKIHMEKQIKETGLDKICPITWIEHFDREKITLDMIRENYIHIPEILSRLCSVPEIANAMAHNYAITQISEKYNCAMIIEDDVVFKKDFIENLKKVFSELEDKKWDVIAIGGHYDNRTGYWDESYKPDQDVKHFQLEIPKTSTTPTACYILTNNACKKIIKHLIFKPFCLPIDETMFYVLEDLNIYWCRPFLVYEGSKSGLFPSMAGR